MHKLGAIIRLQIQEASLKRGTAAAQTYDPAPIVSVPAIRIDPGGVTGLSADGDAVDVTDVHHAAHPASKSRGSNGVSINFTGHYAAMVARFGHHLAPGIAGENILVDAPGRRTMADLGDVLIVISRAGREIRLTSLCVAAPCEPFSRFALELDSHAPAEMTKNALQFLHHGMRGFYASYAGEPAVISVGDDVYSERIQ